MLARESVVLTVPNGVIGIFVGLAFGFVIGLFYYQTYRKNYYWMYSIGSGVLTAVISQLVMKHIFKMDTSTMHATMIQFSLAFVATILMNHSLYMMKKRLRTRTRNSHRRRSDYKKDLTTLSSTRSVPRAI